MQNRVIADLATRNATLGPDGDDAVRMRQRETSRELNHDIEIYPLYIFCRSHFLKHMLSVQENLNRRLFLKAAALRKPFKAVTW